MLTIEHNVMYMKQLKFKQIKENDTKSSVLYIMMINIIIMTCSKLMHKRMNQR